MTTTPSALRAQAMFQRNYANDIVVSQIYTNDVQGLRRYIENAPGIKNVNFMWDGDGLTYATDRGVMANFTGRNADYSIPVRTFQTNVSQMRATFGTSISTTQVLWDDIQPDSANFVDVYRKTINEITLAANKSFNFCVLGLGNGKITDVVNGATFNTGNSWTADIRVGQAHVFNVGDSFDVVTDAGAVKALGAQGVVINVKKRGKGSGLITVQFPLLSASDELIIATTDDIHVQNSVISGTDFLFQGLERGIDDSATPYPFEYPTTPNVGLDRTGAHARIGGNVIDASSSPMSIALMDRVFDTLTDVHQGSQPVFGKDGLAQVANSVSIIVRSGDLRELQKEARLGQKEHAWGIGETTDFGLKRTTYQGVPFLVYDAGPYNINYVVDWSKIGFHYKTPLKPVKQGENGPFYIREKTTIAAADYIEQWNLLVMDASTSAKIVNVTEQEAS